MPVASAFSTYLLDQSMVGIELLGYVNITPVDTGRKLNVLYTFNLRPVSTGTSICKLGDLPSNKKVEAYPVAEFLVQLYACSALLT